jgi:quinol monooxygenase YgiN
MITFIAHLKVKPENGPAFEALLRHVRDSTRQHEPGVVYYDFGKSVDEPDTYVVIEIYRDAAAHAAHMQTDWVTESIPQSRGLFEGPFHIKQYVSPGAEPAVRRLQES